MTFSLHCFHNSQHCNRARQYARGSGVEDKISETSEDQRTWSRGDHCGAYSTHDRDEKWVQYFGRETRGEETTREA